MDQQPEASRVRELSPLNSITPSSFADTIRQVYDERDSLLTDIARNGFTNHRRTKMNSKRTDKSFTIVCVFTDEIDSTRGISENGGLILKCLLEESNRLVALFTSHADSKCLKRVCGNGFVE